jgi:predicted metal-dependent peptidase
MTTPVSNPAAPAPPPSGALPKLKLNSQQEAAWMQTRAAALWSQPAFADIWYNLMVDGDGKQAWFTDKVPVAATDDKFMYINPESFLKYTLQERVFIACHEISHAVFGHCTLMHGLRRAGKVAYPDGKTLPFDPDLFQVAMDLVINDILVESKVGEMPKDALHDPKLVAAQDSVLDAYRKVYKDQEKNGGKGGGKKPQGGKGFDQHLDPGQGEGKDPETAKAERNDASWQAGVAAAMESAKLQGKLPAALERLFTKVMEPQVDWQDKLRTALARRLGNSGASWDSLDPQLVVRGIGAPGRIAYGAGAIWVACDTSGSITQAMLDKFLSETAGILDDVRPRRMVLMQCDAAVQDIRECESSSDLQAIKIAGGGGTSFVPVFEKIAEDNERPDAVIYFTDMYGSFPPPPDYPVIWASITKNAQAPFGDLVEVPLKYED